MNGAGAASEENVSMDKLISDFKAVMRDGEALIKGSAGDLGEKAREARARLDASLAAAKRNFHRAEARAWRAPASRTRSSASIPMSRSGSPSEWACCWACSSPANPPAMEESDPHSSTPSGSVQRLVEALLSTLRNRVELFALDLQEERHWLASTLVWLVVAVFMGFASFILVTLAAIAFAPAGARPFVVLGFALLYILVTLMALLTVRKKLKEKPPAFSDTISELRKDIECWRSRE